jgi:hypothetical protein
MGQTDLVWDLEMVWPFAKESVQWGPFTTQTYTCTCSLQYFHRDRNFRSFRLSVYSTYRQSMDQTRGIAI